MIEYLKKTVLDNIWRAPDRDNTIILELTKATSPGGIVNKYITPWGTLTLPTSNESYTIYNLGTARLSRYNLSGIDTVWVRLCDISTNTNTIIDVYSTSGIKIPNHLIYAYNSDDLGLIFAILNHSEYTFIDSENIFFRSYKNIFYSDNLYSGMYGVVNEGITTASASDITTYISKLAQWKTISQDKTIAYINGTYTNTFSNDVVSIGDTLEIVFDDSIIYKETLALDTLSNFHSSLDTTEKYLIYLNKEPGNPIRYHDDVDIHITYQDNTSRYDGRYLHRNLDRNIRMVGHRCYSTPTDLISATINDNLTWVDPSLVYLHIHLRESVVNKSLPILGSRLNELYVLDDVVIKNAMVGTIATVDDWHAADIESSLFRDAMSAVSIQDVFSIDPTLLYGYWGLGVILNDSPLLTDGVLTDLPIASQNQSVIFEYGVDGRYLNHIVHSSGTMHPSSGVDVKKIECIPLVPTLTGGMILDTPSFTLLDGVNYRFYVSTIGQDDWEDVTGSSLYDVDPSGLVTWNIDTNTKTGVIVSDSEMLLYSFQLLDIDGVYDFNILYNNTQGMYPPLKWQNVDIYLNGSILTENIDYTIDWPRVVISNKKYLNEPGPQNIMVRGYGFPELGEPPIPLDYGFINNGQLSVNSKFNLYDDRNIMAVIDGGIYTRDELIFHESGTMAFTPNVANGLPYHIKPGIVPTRGLPNYDSVSARDQAVAKDAEISDYLSENTSLPDYTVNTIPEYYQIYSPFATKIIKEMVSGNFVPPTENVPIHELTVLLSMYIDLLDFDPCRKDIALSPFVSIHPHPYTNTISLTLDQYNFAELVIHTYLDDRVTLTNFVTVS